MGGRRASAFAPRYPAARCFSIALDQAVERMDEGIDARVEQVFGHLVHVDPDRGELGEHRPRILVERDAGDFAFSAAACSVFIGIVLTVSGPASVST